MPQFLTAAVAAVLYLFSPAPLFWILRELLLRTATVILATVFLLSVLHRIDALRRFVLWFAERELSKALNGAAVTVADIRLDLTKGRVCVADLVIHTPQRDAWKWESPLVARVGNIEATINVVSCIDYVGPALGFPWKDVHAVVAEDVQVFVEKRRNVFNFHLLDPSLDLPDAADVMASLERGGCDDREGGGGPTPSENGGAAATSTGADQGGDETDRRASWEDEEDDEDALPLIQSPLDGSRSRESIRAESQANKIVSQMLGAVSTLGRAANEGGKVGLDMAIRNQKDGIVKNLRKFQARVEGGVGEETSGGGIGSGGDASDGTAREALSKQDSVRHIAMESMLVMKHMGKVVEKNVSEIKSQVDSFQKPPPKKEGWVDTNTDLFRIGAILLREMRIFTKIRTEPRGVSANGNGEKVAGEGDDSVNKTAREDGANQPSAGAVGWSKPILIKELALSSAELCPPMSLRNESGVPVIAQPIEKIVEIVVKRLLTEMAKTNTGRLLHTAFGEVFALMDIQGMRRASDV